MLIFITQLARTVAKYFQQTKKVEQTRPSPYSAPNLSDTHILFHKEHLEKFAAVPNDHVAVLRDVYATLESISTNKVASQYVAQYSITKLEGKELETSFKIIVQPIGEDKVPSTSAELKNAILCVLKFLFEFHNAGFVHCDLRWPNILHNPITGQWFVIDFELANRNDRYLCYKPSDAWVTEDVKQHKLTYKFEDDLFQVGELVNRGLSAGNMEWIRTDAAKLVPWLTFRNKLKLGMLDSAASALRYLDEFL